MIGSVPQVESVDKHIVNSWCLADVHRMVAASLIQGSIEDNRRKCHEYRGKMFLKNSLDTYDVLQNFFGNGKEAESACLSVPFIDVI